jgi:hypothetical protein
MQGITEDRQTSAKAEFYVVLYSTCTSTVTCRHALCKSCRLHSGAVGNGRSNGVLRASPLVQIASATGTSAKGTPKAAYTDMQTRQPCLNRGPFMNTCFTHIGRPIPHKLPRFVADTPQGSAPNITRLTYAQAT